MRGVKRKKKERPRRRDGQARHKGAAGRGERACALLGLLQHKERKGGKAIVKGTRKGQKTKKGGRGCSLRV